MVVTFAPGGDNPSDYEIERYRESLRNNPTTDRVVSSYTALDCIRLEMKKGNIPLDGSELIFTSDNGTIVQCDFILTDTCVQWADKTWKRSCSDMEKHMPENLIMQSRINMLMEMM